MRKNGFTLIELLAVIVILAIIALIATPIILGIINDARKESQERSIELYASAIKNGIAAYQLREMKEVAGGTYTSETLPFDVEYDGNVECTTIELYEDGGVYVAGCEVNDVEVEYTYGTKQESVAKLNDVCTIAADSTVTGLNAGAKYNCTVDPNKPAYTFYVLNTPAEGADSVNLIMDRNICEDGTEVTESNKCTYAWYADAADNSFGPITAMNYLQTATAGWGNVNPQTVNMFTACDGHDSCEDKTMAEYKVNARMPYLSEVSNYSLDANNAYLYDNLNISCYDDEWLYYVSCDVSTNIDGVNVEGIEHIQGIWGYWTLSSSASDSGFAWRVKYVGNAYYDVGVNDDGNYGVRPVINLSI